MSLTYLLEPCVKCGKTPEMYYDNDKCDSLFNIECCGIHIRDYRTSTFKKWNKLMLETKTRWKPFDYVDFVTCDICGKKYDVTERTTEDTLEIQEFTYIRFRGGYGSIFGDDSEVECDICQHCLMNFIKDKYRYSNE